MKRVFSFSFIVLLLLSTVKADDTQQAMKLVQSLSNAMHDKSYQGRFVYTFRNQLESMSITHVKTDSGIKERLFSLNGEAREIVRDKQNFTCIWPANKKVVIDKITQSQISPLWIPGDIARLSKFYHFSIQGKGRVAGRQGTVLMIKARDRMRYSMKIWVDDAENYLLKSLLINEDDKVVEQVMFTQIDTIADPELMAMGLTPKINPDFQVIQSHNSTNSDSLMPNESWKIEHIPAGFWLQSSFKKASNIPNEYVHHMVFTDGLSSLSIFIEKKSKDSLVGSTSMGAVNAYGMVVNGYAVTAVGEVPLKMIQQLVSSVYYD